MEYALALKDLRDQHVHMPRLPLYSSERVLNATPDIVNRLAGSVVLVDFWDYTCINCIRTLPYIKEWHTRYGDKGLVLLGVHSPEFSFEKEPGNLEAAVERFGLEHPVIRDDDFEIWKLLANRYWPAKYLFDKDGVLRAYHFGEGSYGEFESFIQKLLLERDPTLELPAPMEPMRDTDMPGAVCYPVTPETYIGHARGRVGNEGGLRENEVVPYVLPDRLQNDQMYLEGMWRSTPEFAELAVGVGSIVMNYLAAEVNLVINPAQTQPFKVYVEQDGQPLKPEDLGDDVRREDSKTVMEVTVPRMYRIVKNARIGRHTLRLMTDSPSFRAYAFTFVSSCETP